jgi:O-acetyl-ADP-ribose deacetylase (regulator of RNase III)
VAADAGCRSIAFPSISTGVYGFPIEAAAEIAVRVSLEQRKRFSQFEQVILCQFSESDHQVYRRTLRRALEAGGGKTAD